jgi:hypothetical protein
MPIPDWARGGASQLAEAHGAIDYEQGGVEVRELDRILHFSSLFVEFYERDDTLLVHLFPRGGGEDRYYPAEVKDDIRVPGRLELSYRSIQFPPNIEDMIKRASDEVWMGDVAFEKIEVLRYEDDDDVETAELREVDTGTYVVQFQGVKTTARLIGISKFVDRFSEELDKLLDQDSETETQIRGTSAP